MIRDSNVSILHQKILQHFAVSALVLISHLPAYLLSIHQSSGHVIAGNPMGHIIMDAGRKLK